MNSSHFPEPSSRPLRKRLSAALASIAFVLGSLFTAPAWAKASVSEDLKEVSRSGSTSSNSSWVNVSGGVTYVKAVVVSNSADTEMTDLRAAVLANGGSVFMRFYAVSALSVILPLDKVAVIAARGDVSSISPNRPTARTASLLESATGTVTGGSSSPREYSKLGIASGFDGTGVGIAVLDSGISLTHNTFHNAAGLQSRIAKSVNFLVVGDFANSMTSLASSGSGSGSNSGSGSRDRKSVV